MISVAIQQIRFGLYWWVEPFRSYERAKEERTQL